MMNNFPKNPYEILDPEVRWAPSQDELKVKAYEQLLPPLVHKVRQGVKKWRDNNYLGASDTSKALLNYWFDKDNRANNPFTYYFAQRESIESIIYLYEVFKARDKFELLKFDSSGRISSNMFDEYWTRYVIKMATGSGKTKVMTLVIVWSYFHKLYEIDSDLSKNFLVIAPNIIVLNRLLKDFNNFDIFRNDPLLPDNGYKDRNWQNDFFRITLHIQDDVKQINNDGNIFISNIHRVYINDNKTLSLESEFLGVKPSADADTSKGIDLGKILRSDKIKDLVVLNDEAHHIHDPNLEWFKNIQDINNKLKLKTGNKLSLQVDFTATPKHTDGAIFVQTIADYPLVEAIRQNIVKSPVLPDEASRAKLKEQNSNKFTEQYREYIELGFQEWKKQYNELKNKAIPILFIMTNDTKEANETKEYLELTYPELNNSVLVIHTNKSGDITESTKDKRSKEELEKLRKAADSIDNESSPYKAVISVMMLREGWDVRNVLTIVGLRPYKSEAKILPEQTLGRGLRKMFPAENLKEELVVIGTPAFIEFVESIKSEGVDFDYRPMDPNSRSNNPLIIEVDTGNMKKDLDKLDIMLPILTPRIYREYKNLEDIDIYKLDNTPVELKIYTAQELKEIIFNDIEGAFSHKIELNDTVPDYRSVVGFFTHSILKDSRLITGFNILYPKVESFITCKLFNKTVNLEDAQVLRNLSEIEAKNTLFNTFKNAINNLTIQDKGSAIIKSYISLKEAKPIVVDNQEYLKPTKCIFNKIISDSKFELIFASFLEDCPDVISFAKNYQGLNFKIEYQGEDGNLHDYYPDFFVKKTEKEIFIVETKGREDLDDIRKIKRLFAWCNDINSVQKDIKYKSIYIKQEKWEKYMENSSFKKFHDLEKVFEIP